MKIRITLILLSFIASLTAYSESVFADQYTYDSLGRVESVEYEDGSKAVFQYDKNGNIESVQSDGKKQSIEEGGSQDDSGDDNNDGKDHENTGKGGVGNLNAGDVKKTEGKPGESEGKLNSKDDPASNPATQEKQTDTIKASIKTGSYQLSEDGTATFVAVKSPKSKSVKIPDTIKYNGKKYKVTVIEKEAFRDHQNLKKVTIGKNITTIRSKAFYGCGKLKKVIIKSAKLKKIEKGAFSKISKDVVFSISKKKSKKYKKLLKKSGLKKMKIKS